MKVQVNMKVTGLKVASQNLTKALKFFVNDTDTVLAVKDRIAATFFVAFPERELVFDGTVLDEKRRMLDCGIKDGASIVFAVRASEAILIEQLSDLLKKKPLSCDDLCFSYCYKHGAAVTKALELLGMTEQFQVFLKRQEKHFKIDSAGRIALAKEEERKAPVDVVKVCGTAVAKSDEEKKASIDVVKELVKLMETNPNAAMHITALSDKFAQKHGSSIRSLSGMRPTDVLANHGEFFVLNGRGYVALKGREDALAPVSMPVPAKSNVRQNNSSTKNVVEEVPSTTTSSTEASSDEETVDSSPESLNKPYMDLHARICGPSFDNKAAKALRELVCEIEETTILNIHHIVKGGSISKGTAISCSSHAEVVLFLNGLSCMAQSLWEPGILKAVARGLQDRLDVEDVHVDGDCVRLRTRALSAITIRVSATFDSYQEAVRTMQDAAANEGELSTAAFAAEKLRFVEEQPEFVKTTIRLLKWWREQQRWKNAKSRPSDEILELLAVHSAARSNPVDQREAVDDVMSLLARFSDLRIVWPAYHYSYAEIHEPLKEEKPLLMDPTNPFVNVADSQVFDPKQVMELALSTHFFW